MATDAAVGSAAAVVGAAVGAAPAVVATAVGAAPAVVGAAAGTGVAVGWLVAVGGGVAVAELPQARTNSTMIAENRVSIFFFIKTSSVSNKVETQIRSQT